MKIQLALVLLCLVLGPQPARATPVPDHEDPARIQRAAFELLARDGAGALPQDVAVDPQLRLPACSDAALTAEWVRTATIAVGCASAGWRLYVPVRTQRRQSVLVLARPVAAGSPLLDADLRVETREDHRVAASALTDPAAIAGRVARRALSAGAVLTEADLQTARSVRRGDEVTLVVRHGSLEVRARGRALADGGERDLLRVENLQSRRIVSGRVLPSGEVEVLR